MASKVKKITWVIEIEAEPSLNELIYDAIEKGNGFKFDEDKDGNIELSWTADPDASIYRIYRSSIEITDATTSQKILYSIFLTSSSKVLLILI